MALPVREFLVSKQITAEHPPCSLGLAPNDLFLFLKIKEILKRRPFDDIRSNTTIALKAIPQNQFRHEFANFIVRPCITVNFMDL
jgi:hypothetical protein